MSSNQADFILQHPTVVGMSRRRRLYAAVVLGLAVLVILFLVLSFSVREFRAVQTLRISPKSRDLIPQEEVREKALQVVRQLTSEAELRQLVLEWTNRLNLTAAGGGLNPDQVDYEKLRARLTFAIDSQEGGRDLALHMGYAGRGNSAEQMFLLLFVERMASELSRWGGPSEEQWAAARTELEAGPSLRELGRQRLLELQAELEQFAEQVTRIRQFPVEEMISTVEEPVVLNEAVNPRKRALEKQLEGLDRQRQQLTEQYPESHPEVLVVRREIEQVRLELLELEESAPKRISNQFVQASFPRNPRPQAAPAIEEWKTLVAGIDLAGMQGKFERLQMELAEELAVSDERNQACLALLRSEPRLKVAIDGQDVMALGALSPVNLAWAALISLLVGGVIASRFDVWSFDRGFESSQSATETLAVPVFAWSGDSSPEPPQPARVTASARILKLSEIVLFTTLLVVAGMLLIDAEYRAAVWQNPIHLFARLLWLWKI